MDFTNPFTGLTPDRKLTTEEILRALRIDVAAELDAINLYQAHIDAIDDEHVKQVIAHIRDEEKEHVAEFMEVINMLDSTQQEKFSSEHAVAIEHGEAGVLPTGTAAGSPPVTGDGSIGERGAQVGAPPALGGQFTVGSLIGEEQG